MARCRDRKLRVGTTARRPGRARPRTGDRGGAKSSHRFRLACWVRSGGRAGGTGVRGTCAHSTGGESSHASNRKPGKRKQPPTCTCRCPSTGSRDPDRHGAARTQAPPASGFRRGEKPAVSEYTAVAGGAPAASARLLTRETVASDRYGSTCHDSPNRDQQDHARSSYHHPFRQLRRTSMQSLLRTVFALVLLCSCPALASAQSQPAAAPPSATGPTATYKLTFVVREFAAGKISGSRSYSALLTNEHNGDSSIRSGVKVPISTGASQIVYLDVGANFDFRLATPAPAYAPGTHQLALVVTAELSSVATENSSANATQPLIRQNKWNSNFVLDLGKPTLLFSSDDPTVDRTTQVELTVVKLP